MDTTYPQPSLPKTQNQAEPQNSLCWSVHLARRNPQRIPVLVLTLCIAACLVWELFHALLPVAASMGLLLLAASEYLLPIRYRLTETGIATVCGFSRTGVEWKAVRRCQIARTTMRFSPLAAASRVDAFRGITVRFALDGESGDRASVLAFAALCAPQIGDLIESHLLVVATENPDLQTSGMSHTHSLDVLNESVKTL